MRTLFSLEKIKEALSNYNLIWLSSKKSTAPSKGNVHQTLLGNTCDIKHFSKVKFSWIPRRVNLSNSGDIQVFIWLHHYSEQYREIKFLDANTKPETPKKLYDFLFYFEDANSQVMNLKQTLQIIEVYNQDPKPYQKMIWTGLRSSAVVSMETLVPHSKELVRALRYLMAMNFYACRKIFSGEEIMTEAFKCSLVDEVKSQIESKIR